MLSLLRAALLGMALVLPAMPAAAQPAPAPQVAGAEDAPARPTYRFRLGLRALAALDHDGGDAALLKPGVIATIPLTLNVQHGIGLRLAFTAAHFQNSEFEVGFNAEPNDPGTFEMHRLSGTDNRLIYYGMTIGFNYEVTIPREPVFRVMQPYVGVGVAILRVRTHPDLPPDFDFLIHNDYYRGADAKNYDPWSLQVRAGLDVYGGIHLNATRTFRIPIEVGYRLVPVPKAEMMWATEGFDYAHLDYVINTFNVGGGLEWLF